jgi:hypothetical protein
MQKNEGRRILRSPKMDFDGARMGIILPPSFFFLRSNAFMAASSFSSSMVWTAK